MKADLVVIHAGELVTNSDRDLGIVHDGAMLVKSGKVVWTGTTPELKAKSCDGATRVVDAEHNLVTPGFVDPHTHLLFAGSREDELERKIVGESYVKILESGGGIARTVKTTRRASIRTIVRESRSRIRQLLRNGVTTVEVKTGYGQNLRSELKLMRALELLARTEPVRIVPTFMGLHSTPPEFGGSRDYVKYVISEMLPRMAGLRPAPKFSDCFCEEGVFSKEECSEFLTASKKLGFALKVHADEFSDSGGASLAARLGCVSADHLGKSSLSGIGSMARRGVTAVLLPGTSFFSGIGFADARAIAEVGCQVALGTDLSPNSWVESPQLVMALGCLGMKMSPAEALKGFTVGAAAALGIQAGRLVPGSAADFVVHGVPNHRFLAYRTGGSYVRRVFVRGLEVYSAEDD
jgi:imidazolonepropionase